MRALTSDQVGAFGMGPKPKRETRAKGNFTERRLSAFETAATGADAIATGVAAVEIASGFYGRDLALAEVSPRNARTAAITPSWLSLAGRELARSGQFVCDLEVRGGRVALVPASSAFAVEGASDPSSWVWVLTLFGPGDTTTRFRPNDGILNVVIGNTVTRPWEGRAPWQAASLSGKLLSGIERQLAGESQSKSGYVLPVPDLGDRGQGEDDDGETDPLTTLRRDLAGAEGRTMLAPSMASGFGGGPGVAPAPASEYSPRRFGANPPLSLLELRRDIERSVLASYGILPSLVNERAAGNSLREARRQFHGTIVALATLLENSLSEALNETVTLNLRRTKAADSATMARAVSSLTSSGMSLQDAIEVVGL